MREVIAQHQLSAKKTLGQNFLLDLNLTAKIARQAGALQDCDVIEIGPGPGGLTRGLLAEGARRVIAVEKDKRCLQALSEIERAYPNRLTVLNGDALTLNPFEHTQNPTKIVANLPYNIGTELLIRWLNPSSWPPAWSSLTLMFQKEVAQRIVAQPGGKAYGRLSILAQLKCEAKIVMSLPRPSRPTQSRKRSNPYFSLTAPKIAVDEAAGDVVVKAFNQGAKCYAPP